MNTLLNDMEKQIASKVPPQLKKTYDAIVTNGKKLMWSDQTHKTMDDYVSRGVNSPEDVPGVVAGGMRGIIRMLLTASKTSADPNEPFYQVAHAAAITLMCDALEFVEAKKKIEITNDLIAETTQEVVSQLNQFFGIGKQQLDAAMQMTRDKQQRGELNIQKGAQAIAQQPTDQPTEDAGV